LQVSQARTRMWGNCSPQHRRVACLRLVRRTWAMNPAKFPFLGAKRNRARTVSRCRLHSQHTHERPRAAQGATRTVTTMGASHQRGAKLGYTAQKRSRKELRERSDLLVEIAGMFPVGFRGLQSRNPTEQRHLMCGVPQRCRSMLFDGERNPRKWGRSTVRSSGSRSSAESAPRDFASVRSRDAGAKRFLERCDAPVEIENSAANACCVASRSARWIRASYSVAPVCVAVICGALVVDPRRSLCTSRDVNAWQTRSKHRRE